MGEQYLHLLNIENSVYLQAFVTGWILHVLFHQPHEKSERHQHIKNLAGVLLLD